MVSQMGVVDKGKNKVYGLGSGKSSQLTWRVKICTGFFSCVSGLAHSPVVVPILASSMVGLPQTSLPVTGDPLDGVSEPKMFPESDEVDFWLQDELHMMVVGNEGNSCLSLVSTQVPLLLVVKGMGIEVPFPVVFLYVLPIDFL